MVRLLRHRQTKEAATDRLYLRPPRHILTLPFFVLQCLLILAIIKRRFPVGNLPFNVIMKLGY